MTNKELTTVKNRIHKFTEDHPIAYKALVYGGAMTVFMGGLYLMARHNTKALDDTIDTALAKTMIIESTADKYCAIKDDFMIDLDPKSIADTIGKIKNEGFAITKEGLDALQAIIDNPVIID